MSIQQEFLKSIEIYVKEAILKYINPEIASVVEEINGSEYIVSIDGNRFAVKDGVNLQPSVGTAVWVRCPYGKGNMTGAYIAARR